MPSKYYERTNETSGFSAHEMMAPLWYYDNLQVNRDLSLAVGFKVTFPYTSTYGIDQRLNLQAELRSFLNSLPDGYDLQIIWRQSRDLSRVDELIGSRVTPHTFLNMVADERLDSWEDLMRQGRMRFIEGYFLLNRQSTIANSALQKRTLENIKSKRGVAGLISKMKVQMLNSGYHYQMSEDEWNDANRDIFQTADGALSSLQMCGLAPEVLYEQELIDLGFWYWNPISWESGVRPVRYDAGDLLPASTYLQSTDYQVDSKRGLVHIDGGVRAMVTLQNPPEDMRFLQWENYLLYNSIGQGAAIVMNIHPEVPAKRIKRLNDKLPQIRKLAERDKSLLAAVAQLEDQLESLGSQSDKCWTASMGIPVWAKDEESLLRVINDIKLSGNRLGGAKFLHERVATVPYLQVFQPGWTRDRDRYRDYSYDSTELTMVMPLSGQPNKLEAPRAGMLIPTPSGSLINVDNFDRKYNAPHMLIAGVNGSGKSVMVNEIIYNHQAGGGRTIIVDLAQSYARLCEVCQGSASYMDGSADSTINPMFMAPGHEMSSDELAFKVRFLERLMVDTRAGETVLPRKSLDLIERSVRTAAAASQGKEFFLSDVRSALQQFDAEGEELADRLTLWTDGNNRDLFNGPTKLDINNDFLLFDLMRIKESQDLCVITMFLVMSLITEIAYTNPGREILMVMDEAHMLIDRDPMLRRFISEAFRTFRKLGVGLIGMSQSLAEWQKMEDRQGVLNNIGHLLLFRLDSDETIEGIAQEFGLNEQEVATIRGLGIVPGEYSQALLIHRDPHEAHVLMNRMTPLNYALTTNRPYERAEITKLQDSLGYMEGMQEFARRYPRGM